MDEFEMHAGLVPEDRPVRLKPLSLYSAEDRDRIAAIREKRAGKIAAREALRQGSYRTAVLLYVDGYTMREIAEKLERPLPTVKDWFRRSDVQLMVRELTERRVEKVEANLAEAEVSASVELKAIILDKEAPPDVRLKAINSALDRAAKRGKPLDRQLKAEVHTGDMAAEFKRALADPGVQKWLAEQPVAALSAGEEVVEAHEVEYEEGDG